MASQSEFIKSGGSSGDWTNGSNVEGGPDDNCMTSTGSGNIQDCYPAQFTDIGDSDTIDGVLIYIHTSCGAFRNVGVRLYCTGKGFSNQKSQPFAGSGDSCADTIADEIGSNTDLWGWSSVSGSDVNGTDFYIEVEDITGGDTGYVDSIFTYMYYTDAGGETKYIYASAGVGAAASVETEVIESVTKYAYDYEVIGNDWTNPTNGEGAPDASCATSAVTEDQVTYYFDVSAEIGDADVIKGIEITCWWARSDADEILVVAPSPVGNPPESVNMTTGGASTDCSGVVSETEGGATDVWGYTGDVLTGAYWNGTSAEAAVRLTHLKAAKGGTVYVDAVTITLHYVGEGPETKYIYSIAGVGANSSILKNITKTVSTSVGVNSIASAIKIVFINVAAGVGAAATISKSIGKKAVAGVGAAATVTKSITKKVAAGVGAAGSVLKNITKKVTAGVGASATVTALKTVYVNAAAGVGAAASVVKNIGKKVAAGVGASATATALRTLYINVAAGVGAAATTVKNITKTVAASVGASATSTAFKTVYLALSAGVGAAASIVKNIIKTVAAGVGVGAAASALKKVFVYLDAGVGAAATVTKSITKSVAAGVGAAATTVKNITKTVAAGVGTSATVITDVLSVIYLYLDAGVGASATVAKSIGKKVSAGVGAAGTITKSITKKVAAGVGASATATALKKVYVYLSIGVGAAATTIKNITKAVSAGVGASATATAFKTVYIAVSAGVGAGATIIKNITKAIAAGVGASAVVDTLRTAYINAAAGVGTAAAITKSIGKKIAAGVGANATASALKKVYVYLSAGVGAAATTTKSITKVVSAGVGAAASAIATKVGAVIVYIYANAGVGAAASTVKNITKSLAAGVGASAAATAFKTVYVSIAAGVGAAASISKSIGKKVAVGVGSAAVTIKSITKKVTAGVGASATASALKSVFLAVAAGVGAAASTTKTIGKKVAAGVGASATIVKRIKKAVSAGVGVSASVFWSFMLTHILRALLSFQALFAQASKPDLSADIAQGGGLKVELSIDDRISAEISTYLDDSDGTDLITESLTPSDGNDWDGDWILDSLAYDDVVDEYALDASDKTTGAYSIVAKKNHENSFAPGPVYQFDAPVDINNYRYLTFDVKLPALIINEDQHEHNLFIWSTGGANFDKLAGWIFGHESGNYGWQTMVFDLKDPYIILGDFDYTSVEQIYMRWDWTGMSGPQPTPIETKVDNVEFYTKSQWLKATID